MTGRPSRSSQPPPPAGASSRNNEYFVPRDGIDREVITADICRYLGQDALVRPGTYESTDGRVIQGYYVTAYRNLTTAMIQDLKADSARWEQERRAAARNAAGASSNRNMPGSEYKDSTTHYNRQANGPSGYSAPDVMMVDAPGPRYPGTGNAGYNGVSSSMVYPGQGPYAQSGFPPTGQFAGQAPQYAPAQTNDRYAGTYGGNPSTQAPVFGQSEYVQGASYATAYGSGNVMPAAPATSNRTGYPHPPGASQPGVYSPPDPYYAASSPNYQQLVQPGDVFYGRGNQATAPQGYGNVPADARHNGVPPQAPASSLQQRLPTPTTGTNSQQLASSSGVALRDDRNPREWDSAAAALRDQREREGDRNRERDRARHREQDRDERHTDKHHRGHRTRP